MLDDASGVGHHVLDDEEEDGPGDNFWPADNECSSCARPITYMEAKLLT